MIDTLLPRTALVTELGLAYRSQGQAILADRETNVYDVMIWDQPRHIEARWAPPPCGDGQAQLVRGNRGLIQARGAPVDMGMDRGI